MNNDERILSMLEILVSKVSNLEKGQGRLEEGQIKLENAVQALKDITALQCSQEKQEVHIKWLDSYRKAE